VTRLLGPDRTRDHSPEELKKRSLSHIREAVALLTTRATPQELEDYNRFAVSLAEKVAAAHRESGRDENPVSEAERAAIADIATVLG
jgi:hypothetical protein